MAATVLTGLASIGIDPVTAVGTLGEILQTFLQRKNNKSTQIIWKKLYNHNRTVTLEFGQDFESNKNDNKVYWGTPLKDGLVAHMTSGVYPANPPKDW